MSVLQRPNVRVEDVAILIAKEANPLIDEHAMRRGLDGLGAEALIRRGLRSTPERDGRILAELLFDELGFEGERDDYYNPYNSYLDKVMIRRKGIPISLSVLTMAVGERAGMEVEGVGFPGHFLVRVGGPEGVYQDPFHGGELLDSHGWNAGNLPTLEYGFPASVTERQMFEQFRSFLGDIGYPRV